MNTTIYKNRIDEEREGSEWIKTDYTQYSFFPADRDNECKRGEVIGTTEISLPENAIKTVCSVHLKGMELNAEELLLLHLDTAFISGNLFIRK